MGDRLFHRYQPVHKRVMTAAALYSQFTGFGPDLYIIGQPPAGSIKFSGWDYAKQRCAEICGSPRGSGTPEHSRVESKPADTPVPPATAPPERTPEVQKQWDERHRSIGQAIANNLNRNVLRDRRPEPGPISTPAAPTSFLTNGVRRSFVWAFVAAHVIVAAAIATAAAFKP